MVIMNPKTTMIIVLLARMAHHLTFMYQNASVSPATDVHSRACTLPYLPPLAARTINGPDHFLDALLRLAMWEGYCTS